MIEPVAQRLRALWKEGGCMPRSGVSTGDLLAWERRNGRGLPAEVSSFYRCMNGAEDVPGWFFDIWPLEKVGPVVEVVTWFTGIPDYSRVGTVLPGATEYFAFADAMIWSYVFAVRLEANSPTEVVWVSGDHYAVLAPTFTSFWQAYLVDPEAMLFATNSFIHSPET